jgi:cell division protein FtsA
VEVAAGIEEPEAKGPRKGMSSFWGKFKNGLIDIFKEEEDHQF